MGALSIVLYGLGLLIGAVGSVLVLVAAFRYSIGWGLAYLFIPLANLVFIIVHWAEAKTGFLISLVGGALLVGGMLVDPTGNAYGEKLPFSFKSSDKTHTTVLEDSPEEQQERSAGSQDINAQIQGKRDRIEQLQGEMGQASTPLVAQYQALNAQQNSLPKGDATAEAKFNVAKAAYQAQNAAQKKRQEELVTLQQSLDDLLAQRARK